MPDKNLVGMMAGTGTRFDCCDTAGLVYDQIGG